MLKYEFIERSTVFGEQQVKNVISLLEQGSTIPFIARYRKEMTRGLDEVQIAEIRDLGNRYDTIINRQKTIIEQIDEQGALTESLKVQILETFDPNKLEDLYLPYKKKRQTKAEKARKAGLEPLAKMIISQRGGDPETMAQRFVKGEIYSEEEALEGAQHIIAEWINEAIPLRERLREQF
ncbi:MAG: RNA-binding transcriptional accessory protein, partial [Bacteroidetes bacterium]